MSFDKRGTDNDKVRAKKHLGQHFLKDLYVAERIALGLTLHGGYDKVLEIGPGMGVLTQFLLQNKDIETSVIEIDKESIAYLQVHFPELSPRIIDGDFLHWNPDTFPAEKFAVIGNFPYNISSQIFFRILTYKDRVPEVVCMLQKEVAQRIASKEGNKDYGILSVLLQAYYDIEYMFSVPPGAFNPPPKVNSGIIRLRRNQKESLGCDEKLFFTTVKTGFNQRRKTLRNALKPLGRPVPENPYLDKRAEQLSVDDFVKLVQYIEGTIQP